MEQLKPLEHWFKRQVFRLLALLFRKGQEEFRPVDGTAITRVLFLRPEKIGDMVISLPVFDGLKKRYPHVQIGILASPRNIALIAHDPRFAHRFLYRKRFWRDLVELRRMRRMQYDCVVDMICDDSVTALCLAQWAAPGKPRIGIGKKRHRDFYDFNYDHRRGDTGHIIDNTLKLLEAFGIDSTTVSPYASPYVRRSEQEHIDRYWKQEHLGEWHPVIGLNLSAGAPTRVWGQDKSHALITRLRQQYPQSCFVLFTVPAERSSAVALASVCGDGAVPVPERMTLEQAAALLSRLDLLITPDTSLVHIARSYRIPVVGLYTRFMKNFLLWRPFGQEVGAVVSGSDGHIHDISVEQVYAAAQQVLSTRQVRQEHS